MTDLDSKMVELVGKRKKLCKDRDSLNTKITKLSKEIESCREIIEKSQMEVPMTPEQELEYFLFEDGNVSGERYKAREIYWRGKAVRNSGYYRATQQVSLQLMMYKGENDNLEQTIEVLDRVLPMLKSHEGVKRLSVFEHTLSEDGSYVVEITEDTFNLVVHRWGRKSVVKTVDTLRELVQYIQQHHYYESSLDNEEY